MTKPEPYTENADARAHGNRAHTRRKLAPMAYVELGPDNGGILLNLSEGGFAVQSALALTSTEFAQLRFQVPASQGWLTASGRIVWLSASKKEAGIQFTELPGEARREIYRWVAAESEPQKATERIPVASKVDREPSKQIFDTPYRGGGAHEPAMAQNAQANVAQAAPRRPPTESVPVAEPPAQDFRFTDYSMFAAEPEKPGGWAEPARRRGTLSGVALFGILVAALFFALGATVGRGTVDRWIANLKDWTPQNQQAPPPKVTPPASPEKAEGDGAIDSKEGKGTPDGDQAKTEESSNAGAGDVPSSQNAPTLEKQNPGQQAGKEEGGSGGTTPDGGSVSASIARKAAAPSRTQHSPESALPRNDFEPNNAATEHSILVNAPEPGSRPFYVNLPGEAVSASTAIAISARRTLEILPSASPRSERVIIGKLISHSEPFYPVEARSKHLEGSVELRARVGRTGEIIGVTPISGPGLLTSAAATAVREWRYEPTFINGDPAETLADITIVFRLP